MLSLEEENTKLAKENADLKQKLLDLQKKLEEKEEKKEVVVLSPDEMYEKNSCSDELFYDSLWPSYVTSIDHDHSNAHFSDIQNLFPC